MEGVSMVINTNISAQSAATLLQQSSANLSQSLARLSSGSKITSPADDSAGLAVSMKLNAQIARTGAAQSNVNNAVSFNQTQDGYLQQVNTALTRMSELAVSAQDVTKTTSDRNLYQQEFSTLGAYVNDVATKSFNGVSLFNGATLNVTTDSEGATFSNLGVNLLGTTYATATSGNIIVHQRGAISGDEHRKRHQPARVRPREHWFQRRSAGLLQQPAQLVEQQPVGRQKSNH